MSFIREHVFYIGAVEVEFKLVGSVCMECHNTFVPGLCCYTHNRSALLAGTMHSLSSWDNLTRNGVFLLRNIVNRKLSRKLVPTCPTYCGKRIKKEKEK